MFNLDCKHANLELRIFKVCSFKNVGYHKSGHKIFTFCWAGSRSRLGSEAVSIEKLSVGIHIAHWNSQDTAFDVLRCKIPRKVYIKISAEREKYI